MFRSAALALALLAGAGPALGQLAVEDADAGGVLNPVDFSYRYYLEQMDRFPERLGIICGSAYELDKTGQHDQSLMFFEECARRGNPPSMIYLAQLYETGAGTPADPEKAALWTRRAAESGWSSAQYEYGLALIGGKGMSRDAVAGLAWLRKAGAQGDRDALAFLAAQGESGAPADALR
jgi:uncharacterized protein